jgi:hypothetical protein
MLTEADLERCARYLIRLHGPHAERRALLWATLLYEQNERDVADIWFQVAATIRRLLAEEA